MKSKTLLFHAIQLNDFRSYTSEGGILSRKKLASVNSHYTRFFTDAKDVEMACWDRAFGNFKDFSHSFYQSGQWCPNAYGPVTLVMNGDVLDTLQDVQLTRRTITNISSVNDRLEFSNYPHFFDTRKADSKRYYPLPEYSAMEFSCADRCIPWDKIIYILVDPIIYADKSLKDIIEKLLSDKNINKKVIKRTFNNEKDEFILPELIAWADTLKGSLLHKSEVLQSITPPNLLGWFSNLNETGQRVLASWLTYTYNGTLLHMK